jgi:hypothetical protein
MDEKIIDSIKGKLAEDEFKAVLDLRNRNVVALGTDEVFALRDSKGEIRAFKQVVTLSKSAGTLIQPVPHGPWVVSAQGYEILGEAAGVCVIFPQECVVDGQIKSNPFALRDTQNGRVLAVYARAVAFRFSSKGLPQVADWTTMFDLPSYRLIDLLAKAKDAPTAFRLLPIEMGPPDDKTPGATWAKYLFDSSTSLWINTAHASALDWYKQIINREKKALDFAQTFARRNAVKHLLGIQKSTCSPKDENPYWDVTILCWRPTAGNIVKWDYTRYNDVRKQIESNAIGAFEGAEVEIKKGIEDGAEVVTTGEAVSVDLEDAIDITPGAAAPEDKPITDVEMKPETKVAPEPVKPQPAPPKAETKKAVKKDPPAPAANGEASGIKKNLEMAKGAFPDEYNRALIQVGVEEPLDLEEERQVLAAINRMLDQNL